MTRAAKATLIGAVIASSLTIWAVHFQQRREHETMYQGVLRDDARRAEKRRRREEELRESLRKKESYERVQAVKQQEE
ncbi:hypothetical protein BD410DRAFT_783744 [Rickenella mellea]|uniref:Cytochrome c oxidase assembly protein n=1 Tax=Rickenella mellea TaxID=50990 RepID=A0A4Y7QH25_9AGAM|nr:hypothetical protein BD410DRAFT_783744 [Rickenella mellea]